MAELVLFDIDGTLIDSSEAHSEAFSEAFVKVYGIDTNIDIIEHHGMTDQAIVVEVLRKNGLDDQTIESGLDHCLTTMIGSFDKIADMHGVLILDGVRELLEELDRHDTLIGLVTGNLESIARNKLRRIHLNHHFRFGAFGSDRRNRVDLVRLAIKRAQEGFAFQHSNNVFLIGDTPRDIKAGREGGAKTVGVATGIYTTQQLGEAGADFVFEDLKDTNKILKIISH